MRAQIAVYAAVALCLSVSVFVGLWSSGPPPIRRAMREAGRGVSSVLKRALALGILAVSASEGRQAETKEGVDLFKAGFRFRGAMKIAASHGLGWVLVGGGVYAIVTSDEIALRVGWLVRLVRGAWGSR